jgi:Ser/Thr protein kinase RdoA (MazF antagonist)
MPPHFLEQLDEYLPADLAEFIDADKVRFIHCDVIRDHVLLSKDEDGRWRISGLIDFGDARFGDPFYELSALHTNVFLCDREALASLVLGYASSTDMVCLNEQRVGYLRSDFVYRAMVYLLLYEFNQFENLKKQRGVFVKYPDYKELETLSELAEKLWDVAEFVPHFPK